MQEHSNLSFVPAKKEFTKGFADEQLIKLPATVMKISFKSQA